jgi:leader peptidase (prepilin peptidase) / N-methyltransferase
MFDLLLSSPHTCFILLGILALLVGSFLNVVIYRLPYMLEAYAENKAPIINLAYPRSFCPNCKKIIPIWHNIPLLSFLINRGKCFSCRAPISKRYALVESLTLICSLLLGLHFGFSSTLLYALLFTWIIICITFIDLEHYLIPDELSLGLLWLGLLANLSSHFVPLAEAVLGAMIGYVSLWLFIKIYEKLTKKIGMGHGDFKLFSALGAWFGWSHLPLLLFIASFFGATLGYIYIKISKKSRNTPIPFGPFLCWSGFLDLLVKLDYIKLVVW